MVRLRWARLAAAFACLTIALGVAGCGDSKTKVKGKVTLNGKPLVWGTVTLVDAKGNNYQTTIGLDGSYAMDDPVPTGPVKIGVISMKPADPASRGGNAGPAGGKAGGGKAGGGGMDDPREAFMKSQGITPQTGPGRPLPPAGAWFPIPDKFNDPNTSGLSDVIKAGQDLNIDLK
jgi:hypothetical protein